MPVTLLASKLQDALHAFFAGVSPLAATFEAAGAKWGDIYVSFATTAQADLTRPTLESLDSAASQLAGALTEAFRLAGSRDNLASSMARAFNEFWPQVKFQATSENGEVFATGTATSPDPQKLQDDLKEFLAAGSLTADPLETASSQADRVASRLEDWTHTVTVVNTINGQLQSAVTLT